MVASLCNSWPRTAAFSFVPSSSASLKLKSTSPRSPISSTTRSFRRSTITMMPEGPEVRTLVDQLQPAVGMRLLDIQFLSGRYVQHGRPKGFEEFAKTMTSLRATAQELSTKNDSGGYGGSNPSEKSVNGYDDNEESAIASTDVITNLSCKGKFIYLTLDDGTKNSSHKSADFQRSIWITLGMSGRFVSEEELRKIMNKPLASNTEKQRVGPRWYLEIMDMTTLKRRKIYYRDARNFGTLRFSLSSKELDEKLDSLGPDMLDIENTTEDIFLSAMENSKQDRNICKFLMDQKLIVYNLQSNYILAEGLYRSRIDPFASLNEINLEQRQSLFRELRQVIVSSYNSMRVTKPAYRDIVANRGSGSFEFQLQCYGKILSPANNPVVKDVNGPHGRTIWYVPDEQLFMPLSERKAKRNGSDTDDDASDEITSDGNSDDESSLCDTLANHLTDPDWKNTLANHMATESFQYLLDRIESDLRCGATIYPSFEDVFSALNLCPLKDVKCVIVGQDPYHQPGQGHGLAFSVRKGVTPPPSLRNIFKEAADDVGIITPTHGNLESWARQGVLLLNTVLTVRKGEANSHAKLGWEDFTDVIINAINERNESVVFLLWGSPAAKKASCVDETKHTVIRTSHPSPLGATKTNSPFLGSRCFSRANEALVASGKEPIDWNVR
ncbi:hypothetical protein ACHAXS_011583 [Conticribra weissflogii]